MKSKLILLVLALAVFTAYMNWKDSPAFTHLLPADITLPDNSKYYGDLKDGLFEGQGELIWADGSRYLGDFKLGLMHGSGEIWDITGTHYKGTFKDGMMHGVGRLTFPNGDQYQGEFERNHMSGTATMRTADNSSYEGVFKQGVLIEGTFIDSDNNSYEGSFENWLLSGFGSYSSPKGDVYKGNYQQGILNGQAQINLNNGSRYEGQVSDWQYHGTGKLIDATGNQYQGAFEYGKYHGEGTLTLATPVDGISEISGQWQFGYHENDPRIGSASRKHDAPVDELLYQQNEFLKDSLSQLTHHTSDAIDLYFIGMAAHQEAVFYQEIDYIENYFIEQFGAENKTITLFNHPSKSTDKPLVTNHAIKDVLDGLAEKIDVNQDVLFFYLSSHGTNEKISVSYPGLELSEIDAEQLGEMLHDSPIKWKVIMISACYSGSFIPYLKSDHHLVMTAAREDRVSFGCGEGSKMTYFAKAMFKQALPNHESFVGAFEAAKQVIKQWENDDFPDSEHSEPQIYIGKKIEAHLKQWRAQNKN